MGSYAVFRGVLESRQIRRAFKLVSPKHGDQASVRNDNFLSLKPKYVNNVSVYFEFNKNLKYQKSQSKINRIDFLCHLPNNGKQKLLSIYW